MGSHNRADSIIHLVGTSALVAAIVTCLHHAGAFAGVEARWFDILARWLPARHSGNVVLVAIDDNDFERADLFAGLSPLDPAPLQALLRRVASHHPKTIVVDIDLAPVAESEPRSASRGALYDYLLEVTGDQLPRWILIRSRPNLAREAAIDPRIRTQWQALQRRESASLVWASAALQAENGLIRRAGRRDWEGFDTIAGAIAASPAASTHAAELVEDEEHEPMLIRYSGAFTLDPPSLNAVSAGELIKSSAPTATTFLSDKTIIVGGLHRAGRDYHWTPIGELSGAQIWAEIADTALRGDSPRGLSLPLEWLTETSIGVGAGLLMARFHPIVGLLVAWGGLALLTTLLSWISFSAGFLMVNCLPSFFAVRFHQRIESWSETRALRRRLAELEASRGDTAGS